jgi:hypothetical protein
MSTATASKPIRDEDRAAMLRAARGTVQRPNGAVPIGVRVLAGPAAPAPAPAAPAPVPTPQPAPQQATSTVADLLTRAADSGSKRTRQLADKIAGLVEDLVSRIEAEDTQRAEKEAADRARQELAEQEAALAAQLAQVREQLRGARRPAGDSTASPVDAKTVRTWAAANGIEVGSTGRVPERVVQAWREATGSEVAR